ncbi:MAG: hypothetical protein ACTSXL_01860 [Alphaproteobacteria bacterium]|nr:MAG: hypothetical protein B6I23_01520 [Rickettsiaceae bacterium 4572_127]
MRYFIVVFLLSACASSQEIECWQDRGETYCDLSSLELSDFHQNLNSAIRDLDKQKMAELIKYPLEIEIQNEIYILENEEDFMAYSEYIMSDNVKKNCIAQNYNKILCDETACHIGNGSIKMSPIGEELKIIEISPALYDYENEEQNIPLSLSKKHAEN